MIQTQSSHNYTKPPSGGFGVVVIVFFASFVLLALQITNARILSASLSHHYAFAVLSLAMLGIGLGGLITHNVNALISNKSNKNNNYIVIYGVLTAISVPASLWGLILLNNIQAEIQIYWYWLIVLIPMVFGGALFAEIYAKYAQTANNIYAIDLIGAAFGAVGAVLLLNMAWGLHSYWVLYLVLPF